MDFRWENFGYEIIITEDGSPTLRWVNSETKEWMHHRGGAFTETQLIYGNPLRQGLEQGARSALSVGLGLGYNEILSAVESLKRNIPPQEFRLLSFESEDILREKFLSWVRGVSIAVYDQIASFFLKDSRLSESQIKLWLSQAYDGGFWKSEKALSPAVQVTEKFAVIFYDAFSSKTSPFLWEEEFLKQFFHQACALQGQVTTYACMGNLKRALKATGFEIVIREGFQGKRNSTLGVRRVLLAPNVNP